MFGKIVDGAFTEAPRNLGNVLNFNKDEAMMREHGYKPVVESEIPEIQSGYFISVRYIDGPYEIQKVYEQIELPQDIENLDEQTDPMDPIIDDQTEM